MDEEGKWVVGRAWIAQLKRRLAASAARLTGYQTASHPRNVLGTIYRDIWCSSMHELRTFFSFWAYFFMHALEAACVSFFQFPFLYSPLFFNSFFLYIFLSLSWRGCFSLSVSMSIKHFSPTPSSSICPLFHSLFWRTSPDVQLQARPDYRWEQLWKLITQLTCPERDCFSSAWAQPFGLARYN